MFESGAIEAKAGLLTYSEFNSREVRAVLIQIFDDLLSKSSTEDKKIGKKDRKRLYKERGRMIEQILNEIQDGRLKLDFTNLDEIKNLLIQKITELLPEKPNDKQGGVDKGSNIDPEKLKKPKKERSRENHFSKRQKETLLKKAGYKCLACGTSGESQSSRHSNTLQPHHVVPVSNGGETTVDNGAILCGKCHTQVHEIALKLPQKKERLTKVMKRRLWKEKGRTCEGCNLTLKTGGRNIAIHPFRPAGWDGKIENLKVFCPMCLGKAASERDKILEFAEKAR